MKASTEHQFATLEDAHSFVVLLAETVNEAKREIQNDVQRESDASRRLDALRIALYNLEKLELHVNQAGRILNDLRTLRRLLFEERNATGHTQHVSGRSVTVRTCDDSLRVENPSRRAWALPSNNEAVAGGWRSE